MSFPVPIGRQLAQYVIQSGTAVPHPTHVDVLGHCTPTMATPIHGKTQTSSP